MAKSASRIGERGVVADGADIAEMIGQPLELGHQRTEIDGALGHLDLKRGLDGARVSEGIGHGRVARGAPGELRALVDGGACHQRLDALMHIAEPLLEPRHRLAIGSETEMPWLDDAGMNRPDRDLMQVLALDGEEGIGLLRLAALLLGAERLGDAPETEIEPGPRVGRAGRLQAVEVFDGALEPDRRRMREADRRELAVGAGEREHDDVGRRLLDQRHVHCVLVAPQPEQRGARLDQLRDRAAPSLGGDGDAREGAMRLRFASVFGDVGQRHGLAHPSSRATA